MTSAKSYAKAYLAATDDLAPEVRVGWLMVLADRKAQRTIGRILQQKAATDILSKLGLPDQVNRFLKILADDKALKHLTAIAEQGLKLSHQQGIATPLKLELSAKFSDQQLSDLATALTGQSSTPTVLETHINPSLLGGLRVTIGAQQVDRSTRGSLAALKAHLARA